MRAKQTRIDNVEFVKTYIWAYKADKTAQDVARKFGVDLKRVYAKTNALRKRGVNLPMLRKAYQTGGTVEDLNSYITAALS